MKKNIILLIAVTNIMILFVNNNNTYAANENANVVNEDSEGVYVNTSDETDLYDNIFATAMGIVEWKKSKYGRTPSESLICDEYMDTAATTAGDWYVLGLNRLGLDDEYSAYLSKIERVVTDKYETEGTLHKVKATEYHRITFAVLAAGGDPTDVAGIDLIKDGIYDRANTAALDKQGINGYIFALIALDTKDYQVPDNAVDNRDTIINGILNKELPSGGFNLTGDAVDVDITAMAIQALSSYYDRTDVKIVVDRAIERLSSLQQEDGDFVYYGYANVESAAQVIIALTSLGVDPLTDDRFIKNGKTLLDGVMKYKMEDGGFAHCFGNPSYEETSNSMASEQTLLAMISLLREHNGMNKLYDFSNEEVSLADIYMEKYMESHNEQSGEDSEDNDEYFSMSIDAIKEFINKNKEKKTSEYINRVIKYQTFMENTDNLQNVNEGEVLWINEQLNTMYNEGKKAEAEISKLIDDINKNIYPIEDIGIGDKGIVDELLDRYEAFSEYDKSKVTNAEDLKRANTIINTVIRSYIIFTIILCIVIALVATLLVKRNKKKKLEMMQDEEE